MNCIYLKVSISQYRYVGNHGNMCISHLSKVPWLRADLILGTSVDSAAVVEDKLLSGLIIVQEYRIIWICDQQQA